MPDKTNNRDLIAGFTPPGDGVSADGIVIVGAGLAGLFTALRLAPLPVTVISPAPLGEGASSVWAQGGIAAAVGEGDTPEAHAADTIVAGDGLVEPAIARAIAEEAPERIRDLLAYGVPFDRELAGHFVLSREAAHSAKRVVRVSGDRAGAAIMQALVAAVRATPSIRVVEGWEADGLQTNAGRVAGVRLIRSETEGQRRGFIAASAVVLATGGIGHLYAVTTNPSYARGQALAFAARAGARIADPEFVQFHPTALDLGRDPSPLASEALRGEGAILVNRDGERFMTGLHPDAELAPRDVVARGVFAEIAAGRGAYLDCREAIGATFAEEFPTVFAYCAEAGLDPATDLLPVAPAAHYHMGGIATSHTGRTDVTGLWAIGEVACTGLHGANRLASNSLLEAVVMGARAASDIAALAPVTTIAPEPQSGDLQASEPGKDDAAIIAEVRRIMASSVGVVRDAAGLRHAVRRLARIQRQATSSTVADMALAARFVATGALLRQESRGAHFRTGFRDRAAVAQHSFLTLGDVEAISRIERERQIERELSDALETAEPLVHP